MVSRLRCPPEAAVIHGRRRRSVPWLQVQLVVSHVNSNGTSAVQLILENGEPVTLPPRGRGHTRPAPTERSLVASAVSGEPRQLERDVGRTTHTREW